MGDIGQGLRFLLNNSTVQMKSTARSTSDKQGYIRAEFIVARSQETLEREREEALALAWFVCGSHVRGWVRMAN